MTDASYSADASTADDAPPSDDVDLNRTPLAGPPFGASGYDPSALKFDLHGNPVERNPYFPNPNDPGLDGGQVLYHMAMGAKPEDFHPALQPLAQGYSIAFQSQPPMEPGLLGSLDDIKAASARMDGDQEATAQNDQGPVLDSPGVPAPLTLETDLPKVQYTPANPLDDPQDARAAFIKSAVPAAMASARTSGVPASVTLAQAALESANGSRHMGGANNYFGIKAQTGKDGGMKIGPIASGYTTQPTTEFKNGRYVTETAPFRSYNSMEDSFSDHANFLSTQPRYAAAMSGYQNDGDVTAFARGLQSGGYASDPSYADKLIGIINKYNLTQYDQ